MDNVSTIGMIDGNQYLTNQMNVESSTAVDFDTVYQEQTDENSLDAIFSKVAKEVGVDVNLLKAVAQAESGFDAGAVSYCGAQGMMQLMPATAESLGVEDPFDAEQSITGGAKLLAYLLEDYNGNVSLALAAYNAGSGNVAKYGGVPPFKETINYINKINGFLGGALSSDATTIADAKATDLSAIQGTSALNTALHGFVQNGVSAALSVNPQQNAAEGNDESLLSMKDYLYVLDTYKDIMQRLFAEVQEEMETSEESFAEGADKESVIRNLNSSGTFIFNAGQANVSMLANSSMESIMKTDAQSIYQAQASVISPMVEHLLYRE